VEENQRRQGGREARRKGSKVLRGRVKLRDVIRGPRREFFERDDDDVEAKKKSEENGRLSGEADAISVGVGHGGATRAKHVEVERRSSICRLSTVDSSDEVHGHLSKATRLVLGRVLRCWRAKMTCKVPPA
jgi:hypothetical protein